MTDARFDVQVRLLECRGCGAPVEASLQGGVVQCGYCGASNEVHQRQRSDKAGRAMPSMADDVARLSRLKAQIESPLTGHVYDLSQPPLGLVEPPESDRLTWLQTRWAEAKSAAASGSDPQAQHRLCWVAFRLADAFDAADKPDYERAVLETALERLADDGHRHLVRCRLALEAIGEGDTQSAEGWLAECDPMPEVPELDSAYRRARAHVAAIGGDAPGVLSLVGREPGNMPVHPAQENAIVRLRIHALDTLGDQGAADAALAKALTAQGKKKQASTAGGPKKTVSIGADPAAQRREHFLQRMHKEKLGLRPLLRKRLDERNAVTGGTSAALASQLRTWPFIALLLFVVVTIPRCVFDADPLMGVNGYALCPSFCDGCEGPFRIYTHWTHHDDSHSTDGPRYFCRKPGSPTEKLSDKDFFYKTPKLSRHELYIAPAMTTYLILLGLAFVWVPFGVRRERRDNDLRKEQLEREVSALSTALGEVVPHAAADPRRLRSALTLACAAVLIPLLATLLELVVR